MTAVLPAFALGALYAVGVARTRGSWPLHRSVAAAAAVALLAFALGPLDAMADRRLAPHMVQHLLLGIAAPACVAAAAPVRLSLAAASPSGRRTLGRLLHAPVLSTLVRPVPAVLVAAATMAVLHLPGALDAVAEDPVLHAADHAALFWAAVVAWIALLGIDPVPGAPGPIGLLLITSGWMAAMSVVGAVYANAGSLLVGAYARSGDTVSGQHDAGTVMLLAGPLLVAPFVLTGAARAVWAQEQRQRRRERVEALR